MSAPMLSDTLLSRLQDLEGRLARLERKPAPTSLDPAVTIPASNVTAGNFQSSLLFRFPTLQVGDAVNATPVEGYIQTAGTRSGIRMEDRAGTAHPDWVVYPSGGQLTVWTGGTGAQGNRLGILPSGLVRAGIGLDGAYIGEHPIHTAYMGVGHLALENVTTGYCLLQHSNGLTILNAGSGQELSFRIGGTQWGKFGSSGHFNVYGELNVNNAKVYQYDSTYAGFKNASASPYQILCRNTGLILIRGDGTDPRVLIGTGGSWWLDIQPTRVRINGRVEMYDAGDRITAQNAGGWTDIRMPWLPELTGGQNLWQVTASWQIGRQPSHFSSKTNLQPSPWSDDAHPNENPLWRFRVHRFHWDEERVGNAREQNERVPEGFTGLVAEEIAAVAPDAVTLGPEGEPVSFDAFVLLAYIVQGLQHCHEGLERRVAREDGLDDRLARVEALPVIANALRGK